MDKDFVELRHVSVCPMKDSTAVFLVCEGKILLMQTDAAFAEISARAMQRKPFPRPQTYELLHAVCLGFEIRLEAVFIMDYRDGVYFARLVYVMQNELGTKRLEVDARPSDAIVQSFLWRANVFISRKVYEAAEDVTPLFKRAQKRESKNKGFAA